MGPPQLERGEMEEQIEFEPIMAARYFFGYATEGDPAEILGAYRTFARGWHELRLQLKEHAEDPFKRKQTEKRLSKIERDMLQLKVAIQLLFDAGRLGRGRRGPYCETRRFILQTWLDDRKKAFEADVAQLDKNWHRAIEQSGAANIISREGAPALVIFNGSVNKFEY